MTIFSLASSCRASWFRTSMIGKLAIATLLFLAGSNVASDGEYHYAEHWWDTLKGDQMVGALYGDKATAEQDAAARKPYKELDRKTRSLVDRTARSIRRLRFYASIGEWWESLDCKLRRVAVGDGNKPDPKSPFCAQYPGSGGTNILDKMSLGLVNKVGVALLGAPDKGIYPTPKDVDYASRWWDALNPDQMVVALYGRNAKPDQARHARRMYEHLYSSIKAKVNKLATEIHGKGGHATIGEWWETLDCRLKRVAVGDGNKPNPMSPFCAHFPGSDHDKILDREALRVVNRIGAALLGLEGPDRPPRPEPPPFAMRWWDALDDDQKVAALYGDEATAEQKAAARKAYNELERETRMRVDRTARSIRGMRPHANVREWWESLDCRLKRVAVGDGNKPDQMSPFCAHFPGSGHDRVLDREALRVVNRIGEALLGLDGPDRPPRPEPPPFAMHWWDALDDDQKVAALYGDEATAEQKAAARKPYSELERETRMRVDRTARSIRGMRPYANVREWWGSLDCRLRRVAVGDGNQPDPMSPFCAHFPGSGHDRVLDREALRVVNRIGAALLGLDGPDRPPQPDPRPFVTHWWHALNGDQKVAALFGNNASPEQDAAARKYFNDLDRATRQLVVRTAHAIRELRFYASVGEWWESLDCRLKRVAVGDGNKPDPMSPFCAHYPGSDASKILDEASLMVVNLIGISLLEAPDAGIFPTPADIEYAARWWNFFDDSQRVLIAYGEVYIPGLARHARFKYQRLYSSVKQSVNEYAVEIYGTGNFSSVGEWWETLDCRMKRIAVGEGNYLDANSRFCAHYPKSKHKKILDKKSLDYVNKVGLVLLKLPDIGVYPPPKEIAYAERWWNALNGEQRVAALFGSKVTKKQQALVNRNYADLFSSTKQKVNAIAKKIYGNGMYNSVGEWWETLDCSLARVAVGDGNKPDPKSPFCAQYPGSDAAKILDEKSLAVVNEIGLALLDLPDVGTYPTPEDIAYASRWWNTLDPEQRVAALFGDMATEQQEMLAKRTYFDLFSSTKQKVNSGAAELYGAGIFNSVGEWWETLDCRLTRIAVGDGNVADQSSPFCANYPGSGAAKILDDAALRLVNEIGLALLELPDVGVYPTPEDIAYAIRWWHTLNAEQRIAAVYGDIATEQQEILAKRMYADLFSSTKQKVNDLSTELYGVGMYDSVGEWWETLDCRLRRIAVGDGDEADPMSAFCAHYPESGEEKILDYESLAFVNEIGLALLALPDVGVYPTPADVAYAMRWWNVLDDKQKVAALYGDMATEQQEWLAKRLYADLFSSTKQKVNDLTAELYGDGIFDSVGEWWETLDCRLARVAVGDGNEADSMSAFCASYPGSGAETILDDDSLAYVNKIGLALLQLPDVGVYPTPEDIAFAKRWWEALNGNQMVAALYGASATAEQEMLARRMYAALFSSTKQTVNDLAVDMYGSGNHASVGDWWETLDCRLRRVAAGDGNVADLSSQFCAHYPGSGGAVVLSVSARSHVDYIGMVLLGRNDPGVFLRGVKERYDRVNMAILPHAAQALLTGTADAISDRLDTVNQGSAASTTFKSNAIGILASMANATNSVHTEFGQHASAFAYAQPHPMDSALLRAQLLSGTSFAIPLANQNGSKRNNIVVWGNGSYRSLDNSDDEVVDWDGDVTMFTLGADMTATDDWLIGIALNSASSSFDYLDSSYGDSHGGTYDVSARGFTPYASWQNEKGTKLWGMFGSQSGDVEIFDDEISAANATDLSQRNMGFGGSTEIGFIGSSKNREDAVAIRFKGEVLIGQVETDRSEFFSAVDEDLRRIRASINLDYQPATQGNNLKLTSAIGMRNDDGFDASNTSWELQGGIIVAISSTMILDVKAHSVVATGDAPDEWGLRGTFVFDPKPNSSHGFTFKIQPSVGPTQHFSSQIWQQGLERSTGTVMQRGQSQGLLTRSEVAYTLDAFSDRVSMQWFGGFSNSARLGNDYLLGVRMSASERLLISVEGTHGTTSAGAAGMMFTGSLSL